MSSLGLINTNPIYMSALQNDRNFTYVKHYHFDYDGLTPNSLIELTGITQNDNIYKIMLVSASNSVKSEIIEMDIIKESTVSESTILTTIYSDLKSGQSVIDCDIEINADEKLYLKYTNNEIDHQITIIANKVHYDLILFCVPR